MADKFDHGPHDKHAAPSSMGPRKNGDDLEKGLEERFPASDPPSSTQPGASKSGKA